MSSARAISHACMPPAPPNATQREPRADRGRARPTRRESRAPCWRWRRARCLRPARRRVSFSDAREPARDALARARRRAPCGRRERTPDPAGRAAGWRRSRSARAGAVADRPGLGARAAAARRAARRRVSTYAIDPPPAPTVWMSITGSRTGKSPIRDSVDRRDRAVDQADVGGRAAHVERDDAVEAGRARPPPARRRRRPPARTARCARPARAPARRRSIRRSTA